jgi:sugar phosphate isomerase/epimerase
VPARIALQLYTIREAMAVDFVGAIRAVADIGYVGVEPALGTLNMSARRAAALFQELNLLVPSVHAPLPLGDQQERVVDAAHALGAQCIVSGLNPDDCATLDAIRHACSRVNEACAVAASEGLSLGLHNHWWEFEELEGRHAYKVMLSHLDRRVVFQIDTYWVQTAGLDAAAIVAELGARAPTLHIKDGPALKGEPMMPVGEGVMDFHAIVRAAGTHARWLIVELDWAAMDMVRAVELSYRYLVDEGLARGD